MNKLWKLWPPTILCLAGACGPDADLPDELHAPRDSATGQARAQGADLPVAHVRTPYGILDLPYVETNGVRVALGDILITDEMLDQRDPGAALRSATTTSPSTWPGGIIPFELDANLPAANRTNVTAAIEDWQGKSPIHLVARSNESSFVHFRAPTTAEGNACFSQGIGRNGGRQDIVLGAGCLLPQTIHEIGHVVGLFHEQARADRDSYVDIFLANIQTNQLGNFQKYNATTIGWDQWGYDFNSVMEYPSNAFSSNGQPTILKKDGSTIAQASDLSVGDVFGVETMYGSTVPWGRQVGMSNDGRLVAFERGEDGAIHRSEQPYGGGNFGGWTNMGTPGPTFASNPALGRNRDGRLEVFAVATDGHLYHAWETSLNGSWTGWASAGGQLAGFTPAVGRNADGRLEVFVIGSNTTLQHLWQVAPNGGWTTLSSFGGSMSSRPAVVQTADGRMEVYVRLSNNNMGRAQQTSPNGGWTGVFSLGGGFQGGAAVGRNHDGRQEIYAVGTDSFVYHQWMMLNGALSGWQRLGTHTFRGTPAVARNWDGRLEAFAVGTDGGLWHAWQNSPDGGWSDWAAYGGTTSSNTPDAVLDLTGRINAYVIGGNDRALYTEVQYTPNGGWVGWQGVSGLRITPE